MGIKRIYVTSDKEEIINVPKVSAGQIPVILDTSFTKKLEADLGHKIISMDDIEECIKKGIIRDAPEITLALINAINNSDDDDPYDGY